MKTTQTKQINEQTAAILAPLQSDFTSICAPDGSPVLHVDEWLGTSAEGCATSALAASSFNAFNRAGRALGIDASELAESVDIAEVLRMLEIARHNPDARADMGPLTAEMVRLLSKLPKGTT